jgi:hypothetical protein
MANTERPRGDESQDDKGRNIVETLANVYAGRINPEDMDENTRAMACFYGLLMDEDPKLRAEVNQIKNQILSNEGEYIPLYSQDVIEKLSKGKGKSKKVKNKENARQLDLWPDKTKTAVIIYDSESITSDPLKKLFEFGNTLEKPIYKRGKNDVINEEIKTKKLKLRNDIGLPIARGKDPHVNDSFYKFLVRRVVHNDVFGIFIEHDRVLDEPSEDLKTKIDEVKGLTNLLLDGSLNTREIYKKYHEFEEQFKERWGQ